MKLQQTPVQQIYDTDPQAGNPQQIPQPYNVPYDQGYMNTDPSQQMYVQQGQQMMQGQMPGGQMPVPGQMAGGQAQIPGQEMQMTVTPVQRTAQMLNTSEIDSIQVKPVNVGMYNTIDLQNALSANISEFFEKENAVAPDGSVKLSADTAGFDQQLYENDTMGFTTGNGPVIPVNMLNPAENEKDDVPGEEEDVQITTFMPINAELVAGEEEYAEEPAAAENTEEESASEEDIAAEDVVEEDTVEADVAEENTDAEAAYEEDNDSEELIEEAAPEK